jgi:hypothetical protein
MLSGFLLWRVLFVSVGLQGTPAIPPHAATTVIQFVHPSGAYSFAHPSDWKVHESPTRSNIGADDGLVAGERGFRTIYGAIVAIVDDPEAAQPNHSLEASARSVIAPILARNPHQSVSVPFHADRPFAGAPAVSAVLLGTSPVTGHSERVEIVCRVYGGSQILYVMLVAPGDANPAVVTALQRLRDSFRVPGER